MWQVPTGTFARLYSGDSAVCAVRADGSTECFNEPLGTPATSHYPMVPVESLGMGLGLICGIDTSDGVFCNSANQALSVTLPDETFTAVSAANQFACGLDPEGSITCSGAALLGSCDYSPDAGQLDAPSGSFVQIASGGHSSCAVAEDGTLSCWGLGSPGEMPPACFAGESHGQSDPPTGAFRSVAVGRSHACGIREDGTVACWGAGTTDDCVSGTGNCRQSRPPPGQFQELALGTSHSCAMTSDRKVQCWGAEGDDGRTVPPPEFQ
jgi:alpha-tubulin suppressor-like RCC1 family protein